jgi:hypothetical protein
VGAGHALGAAAQEGEDGMKQLALCATAFLAALGAVAGVAVLGWLLYVAIRRRIVRMRKRLPPVQPPRFRGGA